MGDKIEKKLSEEELDRLLEEQFLEESRLIEELLFDDSGGYDEESEEEIEDAYEKLVTRLRIEGVYREESDDPGFVCCMNDKDEKIELSEELVPEIRKSDKITSMPEIQSVRKTKTGKKRFSTYKIMRAAGIGVICVLGVFSVCMESEANRLVNSVNFLSCDDTRMVISSDEGNDKSNTGEYDARAEIQEKLGLEVPDFIYRPDDFEYLNYSVESMAETANIKYEYKNRVILLCMSKGVKSEKSDKYNLQGNIAEKIYILEEEIPVDIWEMKEEGDTEPSYAAQWFRNGATYQVNGKMEKSEFLKFIEEFKY